MLAAFLHLKISLRWSAWFKSKQSTFIALLILALHFLFPSKPYSWLEALFLFPVFFIVTFENDLFGFLIQRPLIYLGQISYSFYLSQGLFLFIFSRLYNLVRPFGNANAWQFWLFTLTSATCSLLFSALLHEFVERPFLSRRA